MAMTQSPPFGLNPCYGRVNDSLTALPAQTNRASLGSSKHVLRSGEGAVNLA